MDTVDELPNTPASLPQPESPEVRAAQIIDAFFAQTANAPVLNTWVREPVHALPYEVARLQNRLHDTIFSAARIDKQATQAAVFRHTFPDQAGVGEKTLADLGLEAAEMQVDDMMIEEKEGSQRIVYLGKEIIVSPRVEGAICAKEIDIGNSLAFTNTEGHVVGYIGLDMVAKAYGEPVQAICYGTAEAFIEGHYHGIAADSAAVDEYFSDDALRRRLSATMNEPGNLSVMPFFGRVRAAQLLKEEDMKVIQTIKSYGKLATELLNEVSDTEAKSALDVLGYLHDVEFHVESMGLSRQTDTRLLQGILKSAEIIPGLLGEDPHKKNPLQIMLADKLHAMLGELIIMNKEDAVYREELDRGDHTNEDKLTQYPEWEFATHSFPILSLLAQAAKAHAHNQPLPFALPANMPPDAIERVLDFQARFPQAQTIAQTMFDYVVAIQIESQKTAPYAGKIEEMKRQFYEAYNHFNEMNKQAVTTDTETDIARATNLVRNLPASARLPENARVFLGGSGNCQRFEWELIKRLEKAGVRFGAITALDLVDYSHDIPEELSERETFRFQRGNLLDDGFTPEEKADLAFLPWSVINDVVEKRNLLKAFQQFQKVISPNGILIMDNPIPIGKHSYDAVVREQAAAQGALGVMTRTFPLGPGEAPLESIFNILPAEELIYHALQAGFIPLNLPQQSSERAQMYRKIQDDDTFLGENHKAAEGVEPQDNDPYACPFWQTSGGYNRLTVAFQYVGKEKIEELYPGYTSSLLLREMFGPDHGQSEH